MKPTPTAVERAYNASLALATSTGEERSKGVQIMAQALKSACEQILEANTLDLETSREMAVPEIILEWLKLTPERLQQTVQILQRLADLPDPIGKVVRAPYQLRDSRTYCQIRPLGVIAFIHEAFPDLAAIAAGLCLKTGNSIILRGGSEASHSNATIAQILQNALLDANLPTGCLELLPPEQGSSINDLVTQEQYLHLAIPYGRSSLVEQVRELATVPVLQPAIGNCYLYWSSSNLDKVRWAIINSHASEPDHVNAIEKVILSGNQKPSSVRRLFTSLEEKGFELRGDEQLIVEFPEQLTLAKTEEWNSAYLGKVVAFKVIDNLDSAIAWINQYSSGHANCIITDSYQESQQFTLKIDSALVYVNNSPRFSRYTQQGESVFLGISNRKGHRRGLISMETLTTLQQLVQGREF